MRRKPGHENTAETLTLSLGIETVLRSPSPKSKPTKQTEQKASSLAVPIQLTSCLLHPKAELRPAVHVLSLCLPAPARPPQSGCPHHTDETARHCVSPPSLHVCFSLFGETSPQVFAGLAFTPLRSRSMSAHC